MIFSSKQIYLEKLISFIYHWQRDFNFSIKTSEKCAAIDPNSKLQYEIYSCIVIGKRDLSRREKFIDEVNEVNEWDVYLFWWFLKSMSALKWHLSGGFMVNLVHFSLSVNVFFLLVAGKFVTFVVLLNPLHKLVFEFSLLSSFRCWNY